jgi:hypothetical protein
MKKKFYHYRKGLLSIFLLCCAVLFSTIAYGQYNKKGIAPVLIPAGGFHVDGDAYANMPVAGVGDWFEKSGTGGWLINSDGTYTVPVGDGEMTRFYLDVFKNIDPTAFPGTNKINDAPSTYTVGLANIPAKNDMQRASAHFSFANPLLPGGIEGDLWCMFAADRWVTNGESYIDFEFNQAKMELVGGAIKSYAPLFDADGDPTKGRTPGDILITILFEKGGKQATLYVDKWEKSGKGTPYLWTRKNVETDFPPNTLFCTENTEVTLAPWPVYDTGGNTYEINQFAEGAINLTQLMAIGETKCGHLSTVWIRTKTSQSSTAELKDLAGPPFQVDLGIPELMAKCPQDPNLPACTPLTDIQAAFDLWKAGFTYEGGVEAITVLSGDFPTLPADVDCKGANLTYTYKIKDYCEQTAECTATFTVAPDKTAPEIKDIEDYMLEACNADWPLKLTTSWTDNCSAGGNIDSDGGVNIESQDPCYQLRVYTFKVKDECGNEDTETVTVKRKWDKTVPVMEPIEDLVFACEEPIVIPIPVFNDNCDGPIESYTCKVVGYPEADCATFEFPEGETTVCFSAYDECGNSTVECIKITVEPCIINCETAFGRLENEEGESMGECFIPKFDRWGWTNWIEESEEAYVLPIYAGAAQCDVTNGWGMVGTATIKYYDGKMVVTYEMLPGYSMSEVHVYVGCGMYPKLKSGKVTVAPGQFTYNAMMLDRAGEYTVTFTDVQGPVWVIAHAVVCDIKGKTTGEGEYAKAIDCRPKSAAIAGLEATDLRVYPNPFSTKVNFEFVSGRNAQARLEIYNGIGQKITTLMERAVEAGVLNRVEYQPQNVISGVLFYRLTLDDDVINGKLLYNK